MIRPGYRLNVDDATLLPLFPAKKLSAGLTGFQKMGDGRAIDWARFIDLEKRSIGSGTVPAGPDDKR